MWSKFFYKLNERFNLHKTGFTLSTKAWALQNFIRSYTNEIRKGAQ